MRLVQSKTSGLTTLWGENVISRKNRAADCILTEVLMRSATRVYTNIKNGLPARILFVFRHQLHFTLRNRKQFVLAFLRISRCNVDG